MAVIEGVKVDFKRYLNVDIHLSYRDREWTLRITSSGGPKGLQSDTALRKPCDPFWLSVCFLRFCAMLEGKGVPLLYSFHKQVFCISDT